MKKGNYITAVLCMIFAVCVAMMAKDFPAGKNGVPGPGVFPLLLSALLFIFGVILIVKSTKMSDEDTISVNTPDNVRVYITIVCLAVYLLVLPFVGFLLTNFVALTGIISWYQSKISVKSVLSSLATTLCVYTLFKFVLKVPLDFGILAF